MIAAYIILVWIVCAVGSAGLIVAHFDRDATNAEPFRLELAPALGFGLVGGPITLFVAIFMSGFGAYGWRLWPRGGRPW